ncbi:MAG TPA: nitroreductase family protein, partial [Thermodesulfobacteriota bacterium]|nr:nitroreductase family protein [Thermodesulfobacteriota bacterium]
MEVLEAIRTRRSIRKFKDQDVSEDLIEKILTAG